VAVGSRITPDAMGTPERQLVERLVKSNLPILLLGTS
jgi:hypothetical protein